MFSHALDDTAELRPLEPWRATEFAGAVTADLDNLKPWLPWAETVLDTDSARAWLQVFADGTAADGRRIYGIWDAGKLVGGTMFRVFDERFSSCEIGVWLSPVAGGRGLITKAANHMIAWAVEDRGIHRVEWRCEPANTRSSAVAKRLGMTREGVLRGAFPTRGTHVDVEVWSLLANEWRAAHLT
ncbi:GNAT family protein [Phytomonospora sp. NPDC050363]|uniref:GNAT family N-acetyltransferase n=1 Tax=Phytomonospora sp. NPDC050363 TaxID=3155642 RepID=UPI0033D915A4